MKTKDNYLYRKGKNEVNDNMSFKNNVLRCLIWEPINGIEILKPNSARGDRTIKMK